MKSTTYHVPYDTIVACPLIHPHQN